MIPQYGFTFLIYQGNIGARKSSRGWQVHLKPPLNRHFNFIGEGSTARGCVIVKHNFAYPDKVHLMLELNVTFASKPSSDLSKMQMLWPLGGGMF